jgi:hypothetical protein
MAVLALVAVACGGAPRGATPPAAPVARKEAPAAAPRDLLDLLPSGAAIAVRFDVRRFVASSLWKQHRAAALAQPAVQRVQHLLQRGCGLDLERDLVEIGVAGPGHRGGRGTAVAVRGRFERAQIARCITVLYRELAQLEVTIDASASFMRVIEPGGSSLRLMWPGPDTVVFDSTALVTDAAELNALADARHRERGPGSIWSRLTSDQLLSGFVRLDGDLAGSFSALGEPPPEVIWWNFEQSEGMALEVGLRYPDAAAVRRSGDRLRAGFRAAAQEPALARFVEAVQVIERDPDLTVRATYGAPMVDELARRFAEPFWRGLARSFSRP